MNIERLMDATIEAWERREEYKAASRAYKAKHGHGCYFGDNMNEEKRRLYGYYERHNGAENAINLALDILGLDEEQYRRTFKAARAWREWYRRTNYERCPGLELKERLTAYIME